MNRKERILKKLAAHPCRCDVDRMRCAVLRGMIESELTLDLFGQYSDESGKLFIYAVNKTAMLDEIGSGLFSAIFVSRSTGNGSEFIVYAAEQLKRVGVFTEDEKELCFNNIEQSL